MTPWLAHVPALALPEGLVASGAVKDGAAMLRSMVACCPLRFKKAQDRFPSVVCSLSLSGDEVLAV